jgi:hypothetical protein
VKTIDIKRVEDGLTWLQKEFENTGEIQSVDMLIQKLDAINSCISWSGEQMAIAKNNWNKKKVDAYHRLIASEVANEKYFSPSLGKEYVNAHCHQEQYEFDLCERFTRALVHISDNVRTSISALKEQMKLDSYTQSVPNY